MDPPATVDPAVDTAVEPLVLPVRPRAGWADADLPRRVFAVVWVAAVLVVAASALVARQPLEGPAVGVLALVVLLVGPPASYSAARVLRPHVGRSTERLARHWAAAVATPYGLAALATLAALDGGTTRWWLLGSGSIAVLFAGGLPALFLGVSTLAWGLVALLWRVAERRPGWGWARPSLFRSDDETEDRAADAVHRP
jgi:hypothetical protein